MTTPANPIPWYKNYILLLIIFIPLATVCGSAVTIYLAVSSKEAPILDDYFKVGLSPQKRAAEKTDITAVMSIDSGLLTVTRDPVSIEPLELVMQHASKAEFDHTYTLTAQAPNVYPLPADLLAKWPTATWYFYLAPVNHSWRIQGKRRAPKHGRPAPEHEKDIILQQL